VSKLKHERKGAMKRQRVKRPVPVESVYAAEVRQELSDSQLADLRQARAEEVAHQDERDRVVDLDQGEDVLDREVVLARLRAEPDDDRIPWRRAS